MTDTPLKPCPFCGGGADMMFDELNMESTRGTVMCMACYATSPECEKWQNAVEKWNTRAIDAENAWNYNLEGAPLNTEIRLVFKNRGGRLVACCASYYPKFTLPLADECDPDDGDWDEKQGQSFAKEGWYEIAWGAETYFRVDGEPVCWQLMPPMPETFEQIAKIKAKQEDR